MLEPRVDKLIDRINKIITNRSPLFWGIMAVLLTWGAYFFYLWPRLLSWSSRGIQSTSTPFTTDWGAHLAYISVFAYRPVHAWFQYHPVNIEKKFTYPFVADLISGLTMRLGLDHVWSIVLPSIFFSFILLIVIFSFYRYFLKKTGLAYVALSLFLLNGGLAFIPAVKKSETCCAWMNVIISEFIPQRSMLIGFSIAALIILTLYRWSTREFKKVEPLYLVILGFFSGCLFLVHPHSTLCLIIFCFFLAIKSSKNWQEWTFYAASAAVPLFIIQFLLFQGQFDYQMIRWHPGWVANPSSDDINFLAMLGVNWGIFIPLAAVALWRTKQLRHPLVQAALFIFLIGHLFSFQPWDWDNTKLFTWSYLILLIPVCFYLQKLWQHKYKIKKVIVIALVILMSWSGINDLYAMAATPEEDVTVIWTTEDIALAKKFREISSPTDIVVTASKYNHWVAALTGRQILLGRKQWSSTYGFFYDQVEQDIIDIYNGSDQTSKLLKKYNASFVVIGSHEKKEFQNLNEQYFLDNYPIVLQNHEYNIYYTASDPARPVPSALP